MLQIWILERGIRRWAAGYFAPVEDRVLDSEGDAGLCFGAVGLSQGKGGSERAAEVGAVDGYGAGTAITGHVFGDEVFEDPGVGVEGVVDGGGEEVGGGPAGGDLDDGVV